MPGTTRRKARPTLDMVFPGGRVRAAAQPCRPDRMGTLTVGRMRSLAVVSAAAVLVALALAGSAPPPARAGGAFQRVLGVGTDRG